MSSGVSGRFYYFHWEEFLCVYQMDKVLWEKEEGCEEGRTGDFEEFEKVESWKIEEAWGGKTCRGGRGANCVAE